MNISYIFYYSRYSFFRNIYYYYFSRLLFRKNDASNARYVGYWTPRPDYLYHMMGCRNTCPNLLSPKCVQCHQVLNIYLSFLFFLWTSSGNWQSSCSIDIFTVFRSFTNKKRWKTIQLPIYLWNRGIWMVFWSTGPYI